MWFTTTGWMMWNYLVSGLLTGASLVLFDGDPASDGPDTLWKVVAEEGVTWFGGGAPWFSACRRAGLQPAERFDLTQVRAMERPERPFHQMHSVGFTRKFLQPHCCRRSVAVPISALRLLEVILCQQCEREKFLRPTLGVPSLPGMSQGSPSSTNKGNSW